MKFEYKVKRFDMETGGPYIVILNKDDASDMDVTSLERVKVYRDHRFITAIIDATASVTKKGEVGLFKEAWEKLGLKDGQKIHIERVKKPTSTGIIRKKMDGCELNQKEIDTLISDVMEENLTDAELSSFITSVYIRGLSEPEIIDFTNSIVHSGEILKLGTKEIFDKHCVGGVPGNRTSMLIVPILAAAGFKIPKTSSRAITSPSGTADAMEVLCNVDLDADKVKKVVDKTNGCIVWGGGVGLAPADDKLIKIRNPMRIDPEGMLLASILAKKKAVGSKYVLIDIPIGRGAKFETKVEATKLASKFMNLGRKLGMHIKCIITPGYDPIGFAIGPALEAREVLRILEGENVSPDLKEKSLTMAGVLLEMGGVSNGYKKASEILYSGKAHKKMLEIINAQGARITKSKDVPKAKLSYNYISPRDGRIYYVNIKNVAALARLAGAPKDKTAGIYMYFEKGDKVRKGQNIMTIYAESENKLKAAIEAIKYYPPIEYEAIILDKFSSPKDFIVVR